MDDEQIEEDGDAMAQAQRAQGQALAALRHRQADRHAPPTPPARPTQRAGGGHLGFRRAERQQLAT